LNARILTREFSSRFIVTVEQCADEIAAGDPDPKVRLNTLRWKIGATGESQRAATRMAPMMALLDSWALAAQMRAFLADGGAGSALFGRDQPAARTVANNLDEDVEKLAHRLLSAHDFERYHRFVQTYTGEHPIRNLDFVRASVIGLWSQQSDVNVSLVDSLGTIPEAMADVSDRLQIYSDTVPMQTMWKTQLALRESGYSGADVQAALSQINDHLAKISATAENSQQILHGTVSDVRRSAIDVLDRFDTSATAMMVALHAERLALTADVHAEREAVLSEADTQRKAIARDIATIADHVVQSSGEEVRYLAREVLLLMILLIVVVLGLPFAAGYFVGRAVQRGRTP
jgi:hypothetical protein